MSAHAELCPACRQAVRPGAAYCTHCGAPLSNRGARIGRNANQAQRAAAGQPGGQGPTDPGRISVVPAGQGGPARQAGPGGGATMTARLELVPASAGRRLGAAVLDWLGPLVVLATTFTLGIAGITQSRSNGFIVYDTGLLVLLGSIGLGVTVAYIFVLLGIEARSGNTIGNQLMGIRSADSDGYAPGAGVVFVRGIVTGAGVLLAAIAAVVLLLLGWIGLAAWVLPALLLLAGVWAILVVVSNSWDSNAKLRGWQDKAAKSLMFDVAAGRNPITSGGIQGPYSFAPLDLPPVQQVSSPVASAPVPSRVPAPVQSPIPAPVPPRLAQPVPSHPDDDVERTQLRAGAARDGAARARAVLRIRIDDGQDIQLAATALIGRNPAAQPGETAEQLLAVADPGRSISKTHLQLRVADGGVWVTDRNSTNGSAVTTPDGIQTRLHPGHALFVRPGSTVHFGDRTFHLGQA
ncbi:RDD family protein [Arthrobacter sp. CJ23]|uniref:RDD family protein n=1 Tax=Arthrobacter sp. CJ23 TaxID=2972479 RepID=UPI00215C5D26|nr:RDD family protein [Arthrobacter sp. CJ23]UVJ40789.1 RDD family protein [Arthrobacter sp. CJ23]